MMMPLSALAVPAIWVCGMFMLLCVILALITRKQTYWNRAQLLALIVVSFGVLGILWVAFTALAIPAIWICGVSMVLCFILALVTRKQIYWNRARLLALIVVMFGVLAIIGEYLR